MMLHGKYFKKSLLAIEIFDDNDVAAYGDADRGDAARMRMSMLGEWSLFITVVVYDRRLHTIFNRPHCLWPMASGAPFSVFGKLSRVS